MSGEAVAATVQDGEGMTSLIHERAKAALLEPANLPSPCMSLCQMNRSDGLCIGCFRTIDEICAWSAMGDATKREVWRLIEERSAA